MGLIFIFDCYRVKKRSHQQANRRRHHRQKPVRQSHQLLLLLLLLLLLQVQQRHQLPSLQLFQVRSSFLLLILEWWQAVLLWQQCLLYHRCQACLHLCHHLCCRCIPHMLPVGCRLPHRWCHFMAKCCHISCLPWVSACLHMFQVLRVILSCLLHRRFHLHLQAWLRCQP